MNKKDVVSFLKCVGIHDAKTHKRGGWVVSSCPLGPWNHKDGKSNNEVFGVRDEAGDAFCHCFACNWHGNQSQLVLDVAMRNKKTPHVDVDVKTAMQLIAHAEETAELDLDFVGIEEKLANPGDVHVFDEWWLDTFPRVIDVPMGLNYCTERGVPVSMIDALDLRFDIQQKRVCFPVRDAKQRLVGLHGRALDKGTDPRYRMYTYQQRNNPKFWLGEAWVDFDKPIVVVEGPFDMTSVMRVYRNVVTPLFANPSVEKLRRMRDAQEWITLLDVGTGGDKGREKIAETMKGHDITHLTPPAGVKDPGDMSVEQLIDLLGDIIPLDDIVS